MHRVAAEERFEVLKQRAWGSVRALAQPPGHSGGTGLGPGGPLLALPLAHDEPTHAADSDRHVARTPVPPQAVIKGHEQESELEEQSSDQAEESEVDELEKLRRVVRLKQAIIEKKTAKVSSLQAQHASALASLKDELACVRSELAKKTKQAESAESRYRAMKAEAERLRKQLNRAQGQLEEEGKLPGRKDAEIASPDACDSSADTRQALTAKRITGARHGNKENNNTPARPAAQPRPMKSASRPRSRVGAHRSSPRSANKPMLRKLMTPSTNSSVVDTAAPVAPPPPPPPGPPPLSAIKLSQIL